jgi:AbrB family looped-hinge helix DNA binding protein
MGINIRRIRKNINFVGVIYMQERIAQRKIDELGRIVLPIDFRHKLNLKTSDTVDIYVKGSFIIIEKSN